MSWRLWYRESSLKETAPTAYSIPIQPLTNKKESDNKPLSSLKRIISSLNENEIIQMPTSNNKVQDKKEIQFEKISNNNKKPAAPAAPAAPATPATPATPAVSASKFFINEDDESDSDEGWSSDNSSDDDDDDDEVAEEVEEESTPKTNTMSIQVNTHHVDSDETAFLSEFKKRSPIKFTKGHSILSNMLRAESTRLANQTIRVVPNQKHVTDELSTSMRKCLEWEQNRFAHDIIMNSNVAPTSPTTTHEVSIGYW
ncbi:hypothetical protein BD770DRAFT_119023 [Pilaira anomala]|nr:hypothetical protein BD770DRAFT_119023 [Pilaira anomala]